MNNIAHRCATTMHELSHGRLYPPKHEAATHLSMPCQSAVSISVLNGEKFYLIRKRNADLELWDNKQNRISRTRRGVDAPQHLEYDAKRFLDDTGVMKPVDLCKGMATAISARVAARFENTGVTMKPVADNTPDDGGIMFGAEAVAEGNHLGNLLVALDSEGGAIGVLWNDYHNGHITRFAAWDVKPTDTIESFDIAQTDIEKMVKEISLVRDWANG